MGVGIPHSLRRQVLHLPGWVSGNAKGFRGRFGASKARSAFGAIQFSGGGIPFHDMGGMSSAIETSGVPGLSGSMGIGGMGISGGAMAGAGVKNPLGTYLPGNIVRPIGQAGRDKVLPISAGMFLGLAGSMGAWLLDTAPRPLFQEAAFPRPVLAGCLVVSGSEMDSPGGEAGRFIGGRRLRAATLVRSGSGKSGEGLRGMVLPNPSSDR